VGWAGRRTGLGVRERVQAQRRLAFLPGAAAGDEYLGLAARPREDQFERTDVVWDGFRDAPRYARFEP
jgi:hypothetical protein